MIASFDDCFARLMENEGGYVYRPNASDPGGETRWGITLNVARKWGYMGAMQDLPQDTAKEIARAWYWTPYRCDQLPMPIAFHVFDAAYHGGQPVQWLQSAVGATPDGIIGPKTIESVRAATPAAVVMGFNRKRLEYLTKLKNWPDNARGWALRIVRNMEVF
jgi:lysozyme family protein